MLNIAGVISTENKLSEMASSCIATGITDQLSSESEQASHVTQSFPLGLVVRCVTITHDVIKVFNSSTAVTMGGSGAAVPINIMFCSRYVSFGLAGCAVQE